MLDGQGRSGQRELRGCGLQRSVRITCPTLHVMSWSSAKDTSATAQLEASERVGCSDQQPTPIAQRIQQGGFYGGKELLSQEPWD